MPANNDHHTHYCGAEFYKAKTAELAEPGDHQALGESAARLVMWTLSLDPSVDVLPLDDVMRLAREASCPYLRATPTDKQLTALAKAAGVHAVFYGRFLYPRRRKRQVTASLFDADSGRTVATATEGAEDGYFARIALTGALPLRLAQFLRPTAGVTDRLPNGDVELSVGRSAGVTRYTRLRSCRLDTPVVVEVCRTWADRSRARVVSGPAEAIQPGTTFQVIPPAPVKEDAR